MNGFPNSAEMSAPESHARGNVDHGATRSAAVHDVVDAGTGASERRSPTAFEVHLDVFEGPFDLLLGLIAKHRLDVTEVALSQVTDEFIAHIHAAGPQWDLGQATEFLVVAATLLDLKAARLLPSAQVEDEEDLALLEARDLLFARLLQYRAYKEVAALFADALASEARRYGRVGGMEERYARVLPEVIIPLSAEDLAALATAAFAPRIQPGVSVDHVHAPPVSVREQAAIVVARLRETGASSFRHLCHGCTTTLEVVARFLSLLELYREGLIAFEQISPLGELTVRWHSEGRAGAELSGLQQWDGSDGTDQDLPSTDPEMGDDE